MRNRMQDTSLDAYKSIKPDLNEKQRKVLEAIKLLGSPTNEQIADYLNVGVYTISPRTGELIDLNLIIRGKKVKTKSNRTAYQFHIKEEPVQLSLL